MSYVSVDELDRFQFHDAQLRDISFEQDAMIWEVSAINATTDNTQNAFPTDMCVKEAKMVFVNVQISQIIFAAYKVFDSNRVLLQSVEASEADPADYIDILKRTITDGYAYLMGASQLMQDPHACTACFGVDGGAGCFDMTFTYTRVIVEWEEYDGKAWYENEEFKKSRG